MTRWLYACKWGKQPRKSSIVETALMRANCFKQSQSGTEAMIKERTHYYDPLLTVGEPVRQVCEINSL